MKFESIKRKIKNPPAVQNFVRLIDVEDEVKTTSNVANFALSIPSFNYVSGTKMCVDRVRLGLDLPTALTAVAKSGAPAGRANNAAFVKAFFAYDDTRLYSRLRWIDSYHGQYLVSRDINVPHCSDFHGYRRWQAGTHRIMRLERFEAGGQPAKNVDDNARKWSVFIW